MNKEDLLEIAARLERQLSSIQFNQYDFLRDEIRGFLEDVSDYLENPSEKE